jgi:predicted site-specific integrase-resolvase
MSADELSNLQIDARLDEVRKLRDVLADLGSGLSSSQRGYIRRRMLELTNSRPRGVE